MSLTPPVPRRPLHTRTIICEGWLREDGLFDIEARIVDQKAYRYDEPWRGVREPGSHQHAMSVRLTVDEALVVRGIEVSSEDAPYPNCREAHPNYQSLIGASIASGWRKRVQECVGGVRGCTHIRELLFPMATVAFQAVGGSRFHGVITGPAPAADSTGKRPYYLEGCVGWALDGPVVARLHPEYAVPREGEATKA